MTKQEKKQIEKLQKQVATFTEKTQTKLDDISNKSKDYRFRSKVSNVTGRLILFNSEFNELLN